MRYEENYKTIPESREAHAAELKNIYEIIKMRPCWGYEDPDNYHKRFLFLVLYRADRQTLVANNQSSGENRMGFKKPTAVSTVRSSKATPVRSPKAVVYTKAEKQKTVKCMKRSPKEERDACVCPKKRIMEEEEEEEPSSTSYRKYKRSNTSGQSPSFKRAKLDSDDVAIKYAVSKLHV